MLTLHHGDYRETLARTLRIGRWVVQWSAALRMVFVGRVEADGSAVCVVALP